MITYRATLDVARELVQFVAKLLAAERRRRGTPRGSRALTCFWFALPNQRWRTLQHVTASPSKIGTIARVALVLTHFEYGYVT